MAQENLEMVRRAYDAFNRGDRETMIADLDPSFEYVSTGVLPDTVSVARGPEGYVEFAGWLWDQFDDVRVELNELVNADDKVVAAVTLRGRGRQSGVETSWHLWHVWTFRHAKVVHGQAFTDRAEAFEAARLSEQGGGRP